MNSIETKQKNDKEKREEKKGCFVVIVKQKRNPLV